MNERTKAYLASRGPRPHIARRWSPRLDIHMMFLYEGTEKASPWRIDLPTDNTGGVTEYARTWAEAVKIAAWWTHPPLIIVWQIPNPINHDTEGEHDHDL